MKNADGSIAYLALGGNMGDREHALTSALRRIERLEKTRLLRCSAFYNTAPWGVREQADFLNAVAEIETSLEPMQLFRGLQAIEAAMGRIQTARYGPRLIDIDLLVHGDTKLETPILTLPHPGIPSRRFVLVPLCELAPDMTHPVLGSSMRELLDICEDRGDVRLYREMGGESGPGN